jgi:myo-inositol-1(or 4)-monophosphatase
LPASDDVGVLARHLEAAVREAGALALRVFRTPMKTWTKGKDSPVSEADIAVDALLKDRLAAVGASYGWLSEETVDDRSRLSAPRVWIVDPIDGTRAFVAGKTDWTISAALVEKGRPILAALLAPADDEMFLASAGAGATHNGIPMAAQSGDSLAGLRIAGPQRRLDELAKRLSGSVHVPKIHSLALRIARVAQGQIDVALAGGNAHDWDLAAADLLVHEADGVLTTIAGATLTYNRPDPVHGALLATGRSRYDAMRGVVRAQLSKFG